MRYIELKTLQLSSPVISPDSDDKAWDYRKQLLTFMGGDPRGLSLADMRTYLKICDKIEPLSPNGVLELEDAEYEAVKARIDSWKPTIADKAIVQFIDDVHNAGTEKPLKAALVEAA